MYRLKKAFPAINTKEITQVLNKKIDITQLAINKKDTYRIKDEITLPTGKPNIFEVLYYELELRNVETRLIDNKITIKGDLLLFVLSGINVTALAIFTIKEWKKYRIDIDLQSDNNVA